MKKQGIYTIKSLIDDRIYIGSSSNLIRRKSNHFWKLKNKNHANVKLQNFVNKYGIENLLFEIIEECNENLLIEREQYYFELLNPKFNILKIAGNSIGYIKSEESKLKSSISNKKNN